jgi:hypothetical protein
VRQTRELVDRLARNADDSVTVLPVLISTGSIGTITIPTDLTGCRFGILPRRSRRCRSWPGGSSGSRLPIARSPNRLSAQLIHGKRGHPEVRCNTGAAPPL